MKTFISSVVVGAVVLAGMIPSRLDAGSSNRVGTSAADQVLVPVGARDLAMGGSAVALSSGIGGLYWNPASIARSEHNADIMVSQMDYFAGIGVNYFGVSGNFAGFGSLAFSIKSFAFGDIPITTEDAPDGTGGTFSPNYFTAGVTYARGLTDRVFVGATFKIISEQFERVGDTGAAVNVGVQYHNFVNVPGLNMGVVIKDVGTQMKYEGPGLLRQSTVSDVTRFVKIDAASFDLPSTMELGLSYTVPLPGNSQLHLSSMFQNNNYSSDEYRLGGEYVFGDFISLRGGYSLAATDVESYLYGLTFGGGVRLQLTGLDLGLDYAFRSMERFTNNHLLELKVGF
ncbi:MAG: PorV/PorQ family protein [Fidelibacterota bacterium]